MPDHLASFQLNFLTPDLFQKIVKKAVAEGRRVRGNHGNYINFHMGDILLIIRTAYDQEKGLDYITGFDSQIKGCCVWDCVIERESENEDPTEKTVFIKSGGIELPLPLVNGDILPAYGKGETFQAQIAAYPAEISFQREETGGAIVAKDGETVSICGQALGFREAHTVYMGGVMTRFIICLLATDHGEIELAFPGDLVAKEEEEENLLCPGSYVRCQGTLTGNPAIYEKEKGISGEERKE
jgi:hypothetical protein